MRIVEPQKIIEQAKRPKKSLTKKATLFLLLVFTFGIFVLVVGKNKVSNPELSSVISDNPQQSTMNLAPKPPKLRTLNGNEMVSFYNHLLQPNLDKISTYPIITGNTEADARIRHIAESRGYKLRSTPVAPLTYVEGFPLQITMLQPWLDLKAEAAKDGLSMSIVSAYRSIDTQRNLFMSRLLARGVSSLDVASGLADKEVNDVLITSSIPGYSKHHTGYALDLLCTGTAFESFKSSACFTWLNANNYENAKRFGFIPSYPDDADSQGPNPEAWEYLYVGVEAMYTTQY